MKQSTPYKNKIWYKVVKFLHISTYVIVIYSGRQASLPTDGLPFAWANFLTILVVALIAIELIRALFISLMTGNSVSDILDRTV